MRQEKPERRPCLYLGCFFFDEPREEDWTGTFQVVVEATSPEDAVERFQKKLRALRTEGSFFDSPITIYIEGIVKLSGPFEDGLLVNWRSGESPPPPHAELTCLIPEQANDRQAVGYGWSPHPKGKRTKPKNDQGETTEPFIDFGGEEFRKLAAKSRHQQRDPDSHDLADAAESARREREQRKAQADAKKAAAELARAQTQAKRERRAAIQSTLAELGTGPRRSK